MTKRKLERMADRLDDNARYLKAKNTPGSSLTVIIAIDGIAESLKHQARLLREVAKIV